MIAGVVKVWDAMVATALIGTDRGGAGAAGGGSGAGVPTKTGSDRLTVLLAQVAVRAGADAQRPLLDAAAAITVFRRAGTLPGSAPKDPGTAVEPARSETAPRCSPAASARLALMLDGTHNEFLSEWCDRVAARGERVPEEHLILMLERGRQSIGVRSHLAPVLGQRGRWLAGLTDRWRWAADLGDDTPPQDMTAAFLTGRPEERRRALAAWRRLDPVAAREAVQASWREDNAGDRAAFIEGLKVGLSERDEPFLEAALDDRGKTVRIAAANLLTRLPASRFSDRMAARATAAVGISGSGLRISVPKEFTRDMARDGLVEKPPPDIGQRAWWLRQIIAATPLSVWVDALGCGPVELVELEVTEEWRKELHRAWGAAAASAEDLDWARALLGAGHLEDHEYLVAVLPPIERDRLVVDQIEASGLGAVEARLIAALPGPWSPELSRATVEAAAALARTGGHRRLPGSRAADWDFSTFTNGLTRKLDPDSVVYGLATFGQILDTATDDGILGALIDTLMFRHEMLEELP